MKYDVVVVGGGSAGLAAAVSAARSGAVVALVERYGFLGGMATAAMVGTICGLYLTSRAGGPRLVNEGFPGMFAQRLAAMPGCSGPVRRGRTFVLPYTPFAFTCLADELVKSVRGLDVYLHAHLVGAEASASRIVQVRVASWERTFDLDVEAVVDASGDAAVAHLAGAATESLPLAGRQLPALVFTLQHVDQVALTPGRRLAVLRTLADAEEAGRLPAGSSNLALAASCNPGEVVCKLALGGLAVSLGPAGDFLTTAEQEARQRVRAVVGVLRTIPPFTEAFVSHAAPQVGVRESRRIVGRYDLTRDDVLAGRKFEDGVARGAWPIELWAEGQRGASYEYLDDDECYDIPLRSLRARDLDNLFAAGRCMSATHEALGSSRVMGTCLAVGEAVGRIAARQAGAGAA